MFKTEELAYHWMDDYDVKIIKKISSTDGIVSLVGPNNEYCGGWWLEDVKMDLLPQYKISSTMNENKDEWSVDAPDAWNKLDQGDTITPDMWTDEYRLKNNIENPYKILWIEKNGFGEDSVGISDGMSEYGKIWSVDDLNGWLKPEFQIHNSNTLNESDDEWSVEAPKDWDSFNIEIRMSNTYTFFNIETDDEATVDEVKLVKTNSDELIKYFGDNIPYDSSQIEDLLYDKYFEDDDLMDFINQGEVVEEIPDELYGDDWDNEWDGVEFDVKIVGKVNESTDEFNVIAPEDWNEQQLSTGDIITPDMWIPGVKNRFIDIWNEEIGQDITSLDWIIGVVFRDEVFLNNTNELDESILGYIDEINNSLKPEYKIVKNKLNESDDEWSVEAPRDWDYQQLSLDDTITPEMWDLNNPELEDYIDDPTEDWKILELYANRVGSDASIFLQSPTGGELGSEMEEINKLLKPGYKIVVNKLNEQDEDEFDVVAPDDWNEEHLTVGSIITPNMIEPKAQIITYNENVPKILSMMKKYPTEIKDISITYNWISLKLPQYSKLSFTLYLSDIQSILKHGYEIGKPSTLDEVDGDEFDVEAPKEWDIKVLTTGDILTNKHLNTGGNTAYKIIGFEDNRVKIEKGKILKRKTGNVFILDNMYSTTNIPLSVLQRKLNPGYVIEPPTTTIKLSELLEADDEFNVVAPDEWNEYDKNIRVVIEAELLRIDNTNNAQQELRWTTDKIINIDELKNYTYDFKPFLGNPLDVEALNQWAEDIDLDWWTFMLEEGYESYEIHTDPDFEEGDEIEDMSIIHKELLPID